MGTTGSTFGARHTCDAAEEEAAAAGGPVRRGSPCRASTGLGVRTGVAKSRLAPRAEKADELKAAGERQVATLAEPSPMGGSTVVVHRHDKQVRLTLFTECTITTQLTRCFALSFACVRFKPSASQPRAVLHCSLRSHLRIPCWLREQFRIQVPRSRSRRLSLRHWWCLPGKKCSRQRRCLQ